jgi:chromatin remodeling complex protein RSC6
MPVKKKVTKKRTVKKAAPKKRTVAKKATAKKKTVKKKVAKKTTTRKTTKKATARKTTARKTTARKTTRTAATRKKAAPKKPKKKAKRKPNPAFMRPMTLSEALGAVVGTKPIPRTEVTKKLWIYIKKNGLQDAVNRRMINADDKLKRVFGGKKKVSMFEMTKLVSKHME